MKYQASDTCKQHIQSCCFFPKKKKNYMGLQVIFIAKDSTYEIEMGYNLLGEAYMLQK